MSSPITIRRWSETDSAEELTELLHRAYGPLAESGLRFLASHQDVEMTRKRISSGECFVAVMKAHIVGTIMLYPRRENSPCEWYRRKDVVYFGQFAVEPGLQGAGIGSALLGHVEQLARSRNVAEIGLDTAENAGLLRDYYSRHGYYPVTYVQWDVTNYRSIVLAKPLGSAESIAT